MSAKETCEVAGVVGIRGRTRGIGGGGGGGGGGGIEHEYRSSREPLDVGRIANFLKKKTPISNGENMNGTFSRGKK